jgi:regulatory protein
MQSEPVVDAEALRRKAIALLARRDRSRSEMQQLLGRRCPDSFLVAAVLDELQARGWLSEGRLAAQLVHSQRSRAGAARIRREMSRRGIDPDVIAAASAGLETGDRAAALALWRRRFGTVAADRRQRERQLRFLLQRGFGPGLALEVLRIAAREEGDSEMATD